MTRIRRDAQDSPFGEWVRAQENLDSRADALNVSDVDWLFQKYKTHVDGLGTREVQLMMQVELKTCRAQVEPPQMEILYYQHQLVDEKRAVFRCDGSSVRLWHFGVFVLRLEGQTPDQGRILWGTFENHRLRYKEIDKDRLIEILAFRQRPDDFQHLSLRRHHKTGEIEVVEKTALGFETNALVTWRS